MAKSRSFIVFFIAIILLTGCVMIALSSMTGAKNGVTGGEIIPQRYRFVCLYSGESKTFIDELRRGTEDAMAQEDVWVSFESFDTSNLEGHTLAFEKAIESKVDGIVTNVPSMRDIGPLIDRAAMEKIPVITIVSDIYGSQRKTYIGIDYYAFGQRAAELVEQLTDGDTKTVTIAYPKSRDNSESRREMMGFQDFIQNKPEMSLGTMYMSQIDYPSAYNAVADALGSQIGYDSVFCMNEMSMLATAQYLKNSDNASVNVVGGGESENVFQALQEGYVDAILIEDAYSVGNMAVSCMVRYKSGKKLKSQISAELYVVTEDNLGEFYPVRGK